MGKRLLRSLSLVFGSILFCIFGMSIYQHSAVLKNLFCVGSSWYLFYFNSKKAAYVISIQLTVSKPYTFGLSYLLDLVIR